MVKEDGQPASAQSEGDDQPITMIGHTAAQIRIRMHSPPLVYLLKSARVSFAFLASESHMGAC
jgi:hypothetical protein